MLKNLGADENSSLGALCTLGLVFYIIFMKYFPAVLLVQELTENLQLLTAFTHYDMKILSKKCYMYTDILHSQNVYVCFNTSGFYYSID